MASGEKAKTRVLKGSWDLVTRVVIIRITILITLIRYLQPYLLSHMNSKIVGFICGTLLKAQGFLIRFLHYPEPNRTLLAISKEGVLFSLPVIVEAPLPRD